MRIKSIKVDRYGPMQEFAATGLGGFTLLSGSNERGKTLLIDALLKLLFRKKFGRSKNFGNMSRVEELPEGFVVLELDGDEVKIDRSDSLAKRVSITTEDFRNIFVVRDSDLTIVDKGTYFTGVSEKLAGLRTSEINRIKKTLQEKGRLTNPSSTADLSNSADADHVRGKVEKARQFIDDIRTLADRLDDRDFERLEQLLAEHRARLGRERRELDLLANARSRAECLEAGNNLESLRRIHLELDTLSVINERDLETWAHGARDLKRIEEELGELKREHKGQQAQLTALEDALAEKTTNDESARERWRRVQDLLDPAIGDYKRQADRARESAAKSGLIGWIATIASLGFLLSIGGALLRTPLYFFAASGACSLLAVVAFWKLFGIRSDRAKTARLFSSLASQASRLGLDASSLDDLQREIGEIEKTCEALKRDVDNARVRLETHKKNMETSERRQRNLRRDVDDVERAVADLKIRSGVTTLEDYQLRLRTKNEYDAQRRALEAVLTKSLGPSDSEDAIAVWAGRLERQASDLDGVTWIAYDAARVSALGESTAELEVRITETENALKTGRQMLRDLESKVRNSRVVDPETVVCRTSGELRRLGEQLEAFVQNVAERRDDAREALRILEDIESEEKTRVIELFGEDRSVSAYFRRITGGRYVEVRFDPEAVELGVKTADGEWLAANALSGGACDQLYMAIRLSIAESMLGDERGFFILDDPFVKSDRDRLRNQLQLLQTLVAAGWQIFYFSAKGEVREVLASDIAAKRVRVIDLDATTAPEESLPAARRAAANDLFSDGLTY